MPLSYLLDENVRGLLWRHVRRHNARGVDVLDAVRVGDVDGLPLGSIDPEILRWAERAGRILVSRDQHTLGKHLTDHLAAGGRSPGIFLIRVAPLSDVVDFLVYAANASDPTEWQDQITFIP